ncbi:broad-complex core protein isoforms 1/2/3/4/5 isoform X2 [Diaphorina citri]|uniref:Broad-complex core protein isoforms 1/2/3/4/5 isoform X2 n=1 Tax=Diaphorina citri TaxID=121845 RepID=A0A3Q0J1C5_DIACI|nr:broad-complex core protein isoforms 1/2/3/4/5 isoform X2 [Diaphorina citri]
MMSDLQHFCLRWNNYQSSITSAFENLRDDEDFIDVTLACDGKSLKAHRVVLSACSPYFRELLKTTPCKHPVIVLQDVVWEDLHALVEFIYHGQVNVHQKNLTSFLKTAEVLRVSGLTQNSTDINRETGSPYGKVPSEKSHSDNVSDLSPRPDTSRHSSFSHVRHRSSPLLSSPLNNKHLSSPLAHEIPSKRAKTNATPEDLSSTSTINDSIAANYINKTPTPTPPIPDQTPPAKLPNSNASSNEDEEDDRDEEEKVEDEREDDLSEVEEPPVDFSITPNRESPEIKKKRDRTPSKSPNTIKSEPSEWSLMPAGNNNNNYSLTSQHNDDSNDSVSNSTNSYRNHLDRYDSLHDDSLQGAHSYLDSKIFAAAGASFNFSMAAALAADSLAGLNHQHNSGNTGTLDLTGGPSSQGLVMPPPLSGGINEPQDCPYCRRTFSCYYSLKRHFQDKHERSDTLYVCEFCHRRYRTKNSLTTHKSLQHRGTSGMLKRLLKGGASGSYDYRTSTSLLFDITYNNNNNNNTNKNSESQPKENFK